MAAVVSNGQQDRQILVGANGTKHAQACNVGKSQHHVEEVVSVDMDEMEGDEIQ